MAAVSLVCGAVFAGIGLFALKSKKPMRFWSGEEIGEENITDVRAFNRASSAMWICFSAVFWAGAFLGFSGSEAAGWVTLAGCLAGIPLLLFLHGRICKRFKKK